jgi:hypothetical protein
MALDTMNLLTSEEPIPSLSGYGAMLPGGAAEIFSTLKQSVAGRGLKERVKFLSNILYELIKKNDGDAIDISHYSIGVPNRVYNAKAIYNAFKHLSPVEKEQMMAQFPTLPSAVQKELLELQNINRRKTFKRPAFGNNRKTVSASSAVSAYGGARRKKRKTRRLQKNM